VRIEDVSTYEDLEDFLRGFTNWGGDPVPYDFVGAYGLFLAVLENLIENHIEADLENLQEGPLPLSERQQAFLRRLLELF
jgi:hypothetical protein